MFTFFHFLRHWCLLPAGQVFKFVLVAFYTQQHIKLLTRLQQSSCLRKGNSRTLQRRTASIHGPAWCRVICLSARWIHTPALPPSTSAWTASPARWTQNAPKVSLLSHLKRRTVSGTLVLYVYWSFLFSCQNGETLSLSHTHTHCAFPSSHTFLTAGSLSLTGFNGDMWISTGNA